VTEEQASYWSILLSRIRNTTAERGAKAQLARELGVSKQLLNAWLIGGTSTPGPDHTLRLLEWVTAKEAQEKSLSGVSAPLRPKTRKPKLNTTNESSKQSDQSQS
jgi:transcriptional regulator with XRE-family HTH domain